MAEKVGTPPKTTALPSSGAPAGPESDKAGASHGEKPQYDGAKSAATKGDPPKTGMPGPNSAKSSPPRPDTKKPDASAAKPDPQPSAARPGEKKAGDSPPKSGSQQHEPTKTDSLQPPPATTDAKHPSPPKSEAANVKMEPQANVLPQPVSGKLSPSRPDQRILSADVVKPGGGVHESPGAATAILELSPPNFQPMQPGPDFHSSNPAEGGIVGDKFCFFVVMSIILAIPIIAIPLLLISKGSDWNVSMSTDQTSAAVVVRINLSSTKHVNRRTTSARIGIEQAGTSTTQMFSRPRKEQGLVCHSTHCLALASLLQSRLNRTVDPCVDFYGYVCGSGHGNTSSVTPKHTTKPLIEQVNQAMRGAAHWGRNLYASCLKFSERAEQELDIIREFMASLKLELGDVSQDPHEDPLDRMVQLSLVYAFPVIISLAVESMVHVEGRSILQLSLNNEDFQWFRLVSKVHHSQLQVYYLKVLHLHRMLPQSAASKDYRESIIPLEKRVAGFITNDIKENASNALDAVVMKVRGLNRFTPGSVSSDRWARLIAKRSGHLFGADDSVLASLSALRLVDLLVRAATSTDGRRLVATRLFAALVRGTHLESKLLGPLTHGAAPIKVKHHCLQKVSRAMSVPLNWPLSPSHVEAASAAAAVAHHIRKVMAWEAGLQLWLTGQQLEQAVRKLFDVRFSVGLTEDAIAAALDQPQYGNQARSTGASFVKTWLEAQMTTQRIRLKLNRSRVQEELNAFHLRNAIYSGTTERLVVPAALTEAPIFFVEGPASYNYGSLGQVIAHELFHVFSQLSDKVATNAGPLAAWNDRVPHPFWRKMGCLLDSYKKVRNNNERPSTTRGYYLLADLVGLTTAHKAFDSLRRERGVTRLLPGLRFTPDQLFFVGHCALHCSLASSARDRDALRQRIAARERCHLPLMQMTQFGRSFNCKLGSSLHPFAKCNF